MSNSSPNKSASFQKLFSTGVAGWIAGSVALFVVGLVLAESEPVAEALMWPFFHWWAAFAFGLVALVAVGLLTKESLRDPLIAYLLPVGASAAVAGVCLAIYPDSGFRDELMYTLPLVLAFYVAGAVWMRIRKTDKFFFVQAVLPGLIGGLSIMAFVEAATFSSNAFRYRNAFGFTVVKSSSPAGGIVAEAILEIRKPGHYRFSAIHFDVFGFGMGPDFNGETGKGEITWGAAGEPKEGMTGSFPLVIRWLKANPPQKMPQMPDFMNTAILEMRDAGAPETVLYTVASPIPLEVK